MKLFATDVFTPNDFPEHTYVARAGEDLERKLERAVATHKNIQHTVRYTELAPERFKDFWR